MRMIYSFILSIMSLPAWAQDEICVDKPFYLFEWFDAATGNSSTFDIIGGSADYELPNGHTFNGAVDSTWIVITSPGTLIYTRIVVNNEDGKSTIGTYDQIIVAIDCDVKTDTAVIDTAITETKGILWMPNVFSPNGDSINDIIYPFSNEEMLVDQLMIFDRWGTKVFHRSSFSTNDEFYGWDGYNQDPGVFVWVIKTHGKLYRGDITLVR